MGSSRQKCAGCRKEISSYPCVFCGQRSRTEGPPGSSVALFVASCAGLLILAAGAGFFLLFGLPEKQSRTLQLSEASDAWVTTGRLNRRTCPKVSCGSVGVYFLGDGVQTYEQRNGWVRVSRRYDASCFNGKSEYVDSGNDACSEGNGIVDGQFAEWVSAAYLSSEQPSDPAVGATGYHALVGDSDDYQVYGDAFAKAASELITAGSCTRADFEELGAWLKSSLRGAAPIYFTYCGEMTLAHRLYLNAATGEVFR